MDQNVEHPGFGLLARQGLSVAGLGQGSHTIHIAPGYRQFSSGLCQGVSGAPRCATVSNHQHGGFSEPDVALALVQPWVSINNDSEGTSTEGLLGEQHPHPRAYGTFPRILRKYVREEKKLSLEEAIRKFSALPAARLRLADRGVLKAGMWADVVVFDPETVRDAATFENPNQLSQGMEYVLVNGELVIDGGKKTGALPGKVLRGPGWKER